MMRFYGVSDRDLMAMPFTRLLLLYDKISHIQIEEEMRLLVLHHTGDPQARMTDLQEQLHGIDSTVAIQPGKPIESKAGFVEHTTDEEFLALRERQRAAATERKAEWDARQRAAQEGDLSGAVPAPPAGGGDPRG